MVIGGRNLARIQVDRIPGGYVTKFAPHTEAPKSIARGKLTFDERVVLHRVG